MLKKRSMVQTRRKGLRAQTTEFGFIGSPETHLMAILLIGATFRTPSPVTSSGRDLVSTPPGFLSTQVKAKHFLITVFLLQLVISA